MARKPVLDRKGRFRVTGHHLRHPKELLGLLTGRPSPRRTKVSTSLRFLHEVLGLERFHYGLWEDDPLTLHGLKAAQERYSDVLLSWIPDRAESVLDVGCGIGVDADRLCAKGYEVEGLSPDPHQEAEFRARTGLPFHLTRFQDFEPTRHYDLILMSESAQYVWLESLFAKIEQLAPSGYLLLSDYFVVGEPTNAGDRSGHRLEDFRRRAEEKGFELLREDDLTQRTLPTLTLASSWLESYVDPTTRLLADAARLRFPRLARIAYWALRPTISKIAAQRSLLDPSEFERCKRYFLMLWRVPDPGGKAS